MRINLMSIAVPTSSLQLWLPVSVSHPSEASVSPWKVSADELSYTLSFFYTFPLLVTIQFSTCFPVRCTCRCCENCFRKSSLGQSFTGDIVSRLCPSLLRFLHCAGFFVSFFLSNTKFLNTLRQHILFHPTPLRIDPGILFIIVWRLSPMQSVLTGPQRTR